MEQCEHDFQIDPVDGQVKCKKCGDYDDEMEIEIETPIAQAAEIEFDKSQISFE